MFKLLTVANAYFYDQPGFTQVSLHYQTDTRGSPDFYYTSKRPTAVTNV